MYVGNINLLTHNTDDTLGSSDANKAVHISLIQPGPETLQTVSSFHPRFTYPIFGEEERIFGYQGLRINLRFAAHDVYPNVGINYDSKFKTVGETKATNIEETLKEWLPACKSQLILRISVKPDNGPTQTLSTDSRILSPGYRTMHQQSRSNRRESS